MPPLPTPDSRVTSFEAATSYIGTIPEEYEEDEEETTLRRAFTTRSNAEDGDFVSIDRVGASSSCHSTSSCKSSDLFVDSRTSNFTYWLCGGHAAANS